MIEFAHHLLGTEGYDKNGIHCTGWNISADSTYSVHVIERVLTADRDVLAEYNALQAMLLLAEGPDAIDDCYDALRNFILYHPGINDIAAASGNIARITKIVGGAGGHKSSLGPPA